jgi:hypothetical protein
MIRFIHSHPKFEKMLDALKTSEKMAVSAAKKADDIIAGIIENGDTPLSRLGKFARHGEVRIKNCIKFDIGKGYRMVCVKENDALYLLFVGTHDDCSAWIENNRNFTPDPGRKNTITYTVTHPTGPESQDDSLPVEPDYDALLFERITDRDLKTVFQGLIQSAS